MSSGKTATAWLRISSRKDLQQTISLRLVIPRCKARPEVDGSTLHSCRMHLPSNELKIANLLHGTVLSLEALQYYTAA